MPDRNGVVRYYRHDSVVTGWEIKLDQPGRLRLKNRVLYRKSELVPGHRAGADERPGDRPVQDQLAHLHGPGRLRPAAARQVSRSSRSSTRPSPTPSTRPGSTSWTCTCRSARPRCRSRRRPSSPSRPLLPAAAAVFAYTSIPTFAEAYKRPVQGEAARRGRARLDRGHRLPGDHGDLPRGGALLVPQLRPGPGQADAGQLQEAAAERLRQAAAVRLALPRRRRGPGPARPAPEGRHHRRQHRRGGAGRRARRRGDGDDRPARADRRVDAGREGRRRPGLRLDGDGGRQGLRLGRDRRAARRPRPRSARSSTTRPVTSSPRSTRASGWPTRR